MDRRKKDIETYERRVKRLEWYRELYHRYHIGMGDWITSSWRKDQLEIMDRIRRSGFDVPLCWRCMLQEHDGNAPV